MKRILGLSAFSLLSLIINVFASAPDNLLSQKLSVSFNVPANNAIGIHEFFLIDAVNSTSYYFKTSNDSSDSPFWLSELYHYRKTSSTDATLRIISSDGGWVDIMLSFTSSNFASSTVSGYGTNGEVEWTGTADVSVFDLQISEIPSANQPNILATDLSPTSISGGTLSAQDSYWPVYDETISFPTDASFSASITNGQDDPTGSGSYSYSKTGTNSATLSYSIDGAGISFEYALQFTADNTGIYTKFADYGGGSTDITTGPFSLSGVAIPEQFDWEDYDDFSSGSLDSSKWDLAKWDGGEFPVLEGGKLKFTGQPNSSSSVNVATSAMLAISSDASDGDPTSQSPHSILEFKESQNLEGVELTFSIPSGVPNQMGFGLYAVNYQAMFNSQSDSEEESAILFNMDLWADNSLAATLEFDAKDPTTGVEQGIDKSISFDSSYQVSFIRGDSQIFFYMNGDLIGEFPYSDVGEHFIVRAMNEINQPFTVYLDHVRVLRRSQASTEPDPVTVVSDPNGQPVVVQVGDEYKWNDTLDGVTLWGVWEDSEDGWIGATVAYENGVQKASIGITDQLSNNLEVNHPYIIDENGMVKVTEDTAFQYYQVTAVESGVIVTADDSSFPLSDTSRFFTTRAAAEEYYYSKVNPKSWIWFDHYPWVYSEEEGDWLYFYPSGGTLMYWSNKGQAWRQFN